MSRQKIMPNEKQAGKYWGVSICGTILPNVFWAIVIINCLSTTSRAAIRSAENSVSIKTKTNTKTYRLHEATTDNRTYTIQQSLSLSGTLFATQPKAKPLPLKLAAAAQLAYRERRLTGRGRDALAFRSLRYYDTATVRATVAKNVTTRKINANHRLIVAQGTAGSPVFYSPSGAMSYDELELLAMPGDNLALLALLPTKNISLNEKWTPPTWAIQMLAGVEAAEKATATCQFISITKQQARVTFTGTISGARDGAATSVSFSGYFLYDLNKKYLQYAELRQTEKSREGPIAPAMTVTAKIVLKRSIAKNEGPLKASQIKKIRLEPTARELQIQFELTKKFRLHHSRNWHTFHQTESEVILRRMNRGNFIAQLTLRSLPATTPGNHVSEKQFQQDIRAALGTQLKKIVKAEELRQKGQQRYLYRVVVDGRVKNDDIRWIYYLCADPSGQQLSMVFTVEKQLLKSFGNDHEAIAAGIQFLKK